MKAVVFLVALAFVVICGAWLFTSEHSPVVSALGIGTEGDFRAEASSQVDSLVEIREAAQRAALNRPMKKSWSGRFQNSRAKKIADDSKYDAEGSVSYYVIRDDGSSSSCEDLFRRGKTDHKWQLVSDPGADERERLSKGSGTSPEIASAQPVSNDGGTLRGHASVSLASGMSNLFPGLEIRLLPRTADAKEFQQEVLSLSDRVIRGWDENLPNLRKSWGDNADLAKVLDDFAGLARTSRKFDGAIRKDFRSGKPIDLQNLYLGIRGLQSTEVGRHYAAVQAAGFGQGTFNVLYGVIKGDALWPKITSATALGNVNCASDGSWVFRDVPEGPYYVYALSITDNYVVEWMQPVQIERDHAVQLELTNANAQQLANRR